VTHLVPPPKMGPYINNHLCDRHDDKIIDFLEFLANTKMALYGNNINKRVEMSSYLKQ